ncbi:carbohydrate kinase [Pseudooceanicola sp.]|uniref:carbohydrate kinase family protein n=1 Tax=Pseudooceanicola sp. TaxID=1914328 RepID=UPI00260979D2|nr:carbohydrate kinase [Pseudooceanicola sp.]MDF1855043.1 carbohydrate kinase [Pseudooceanicola sp.]
MILCCGEALIDMVPAESAAGETGFVPLPGGSVFNTAIALARLGAGVAMLTGLSRDSFGVRLEAALIEAGVGTDLLIRSDRPTTLAFAHLDQGQARYEFHDENSAGRMICDADMPLIPAEVTCLYFGGISLIGEPGADTYARFAVRMAARHLLVVDPNIRPGLIGDEAGYRARLLRLLALADIAKASGDDLDWLFPDLTGIAAQADALRRLGATLVVITRGAAGAVGFARDWQVAVAAVPGPVVDTIGAGDIFAAGLLVRLGELGIRGKADLAGIARATLKDAMGYAAQVAALSIRHRGAVAPCRDEVQMTLDAAAPQDLPKH